MAAQIDTVVTVVQITMATACHSKTHFRGSAAGDQDRGCELRRDREGAEDARAGHTESNEPALESLTPLRLRLAGRRVVREALAG